MALEQEEEAGGGIPEWVVTFGDMMSLLLTFFIMLVSLSEIKQDEQYQAMVESITKRFGYESALQSFSPGQSQPRNAQVAKVANEGRARRRNSMQGGDKVQAPVGDYQRVRIIRPGEKTNIGTVIFFEEGSAELNDASQRELSDAVVSLGGKPQKIEVRGHTTRRPLGDNAAYKSHWELAYQRCWNTFQYLTEQQGIKSNRIRISVAGPNEPMRIDPSPNSQRENPRVEIFMLDEIASDLMGTTEEQEKRYTEGDIP